MINSEQFRALACVVQRALMSDAEIPTIRAIMVDLQKEAAKEDAAQAQAAKAVAG